MKDLTVVEHGNQRILTTQQLAEGYGATTRNISENFNNHKARFIEGKHYYCLEGVGLKAFKSEYDNIGLAQNVNKLYLWTERGALRHAKILATDEAWEVYETLEDTYFRVQQPQTQIQVLVQAVNLLAEQERRMLQLEASNKEQTQTLKTIKETVIATPDDWRGDVNRMFNRIVRTLGNKRYQEIRTESYKLLEQRAHVLLGRRLLNLRVRLMEQGASKTKINKACKLDVIEQDPKLREIYSKIIQEYTIKYVA